MDINSKEFSAKIYKDMAANTLKGGAARASALAFYAYIIEHSDDPDEVNKARNTYSLLNMFDKLCKMDKDESKKEDKEENKEGS